MIRTWCLVSREYPPRSGGGIGTYASIFARLLGDHGIRVVVVTAHAAPRSDEADGQIHVIRLPLNADETWIGPHPTIDTPEYRKMWHELGPHSVFSAQVASLVPELLDRFGVDAIEGCETGAPLWHLLHDRSAGKWAADVRVLTHAHSPSLWIEGLNRRLEQTTAMHELQRMEREQTRASDAVVTPSFGMQRWLADHFGVNAGVIRYPFPLTDQTDDDDDDTNNDETGKHTSVLFVGRLEYRKGIDTLLKAWPTVKADARLTIAGSDTTDYRINAPIGATLLRDLDRVEHIGPQTPDRIRSLQAAASVVVVPSPDDNFPFTCIEAMASGRVVVAADRGGASEMIEHGRSGFLFKPGDAKGLADTLDRALATTANERSAMERAARERIGDICDPETVLAARLSHAEGASGSVVASDAASGVPRWLRSLGARSAAARDRRPLARRLIDRLFRASRNG
ncbi:MAG: glycosyltransferase family 4 protein [Planctomycetota bacterium]